MNKRGLRLTTEQIITLLLVAVVIIFLLFAAREKLGLIFG